jgi:uncharacterized protein involved in exopolysaccharide biosynthesis
VSILKRIGLASLLVAFVVVGGGYVVWKSYPAKFKAHALLQVNARQPKVLYETGEIVAGEDYKRFQNTQLKLVKSQLVLETALQDREVSKYRMIGNRVNAIAWLEANLDVKFLSDSEVMEIALSGENADEVAGIVNAVKKAYVEEIVNVEREQLVARHDALKKLKGQYENVIKERRENVRRLSESLESDDGLTVIEREKAELFLSQALWSERLKLQLDQAEAETLLARRKGATGPASDAVRKEIAQLEDRLAVVVARRKVVDEELERLSHGGSSRQQVTRRKLDLTELNRDIAMMEESHRKIGAEVEKLNVELGAPPRVRTIEDAAPPMTRS